jgi:hypothetical protein
MASQEKSAAQGVPQKRLKQAGRLAPTYPNAGYCFCANVPKPGRALINQSLTGFLPIAC